jgi:hypothetical protein
LADAISWLFLQVGSTVSTGGRKGQVTEVESEHVEVKWLDQAEDSNGRLTFKELDKYEALCELLGVDAAAGEAVHLAWRAARSGRPKAHIASQQWDPKARAPCL